jgi:1-acyl-sn-glycerol-3-phosphate acyltransferase
MSLTHVLCTVKNFGKTVAGGAITYSLLTPIWISKWFGRIQVQGHPPPRHTLSSGGTLFVANHPSLIETIALPALLSPWHWNKKSAHQPYSVADSRLFGRHSEWLYEHFCCITVHRNELSSTGKSWRTVRSCLHKLTNQGRLIVYPEGGRTCKGNEWIHYKHRVVRSCNSTIVKLANHTHATIVPVWIDHGDCSTPQSLLRGYYKLFFQEKLVVTFGSPITFSSAEVTDIEVAQALLHVTPAIKT